MYAKYANGKVPLNLLVKRPCRGGTCLMMPGTAAKFDKLVSLAQAEAGWTPEVSGPDDAYRRIEVQDYYWETLPYPQAAFPGTSSHGGTYEGSEAGALDIGNWSEVGRDRFFDLARRAGFRPGYFDGTGGKPYEPWHIIDWTPWDAPTPTPTPELSLEDEMIRIQSPGRGIALVGPGYYRHLANDEEVSNSDALISKHVSGNDRQFDLWVSMALNGAGAGVSGLDRTVRQEARPLKLYTNNGKLILVGPGGKVWDVPAGYRELLEALGLVGPSVVRDLPDNELAFLKQVLGTVSPDGDAPKA